MVAFEQLVVEWDSLRTELEQNRPSPVASPAGSRRGRTGRPAHDAISMALDKLVQLEHSTLQMATVGGRRSFGTRGQRRPEASGVSVCSVTGGAATGILGSGFRASAILGESGVQKMPVGALDTNAQTDNLEGDLQSEERGTGAGHKGDQQQLGSPHGSGTLDWGAQVRGDLDSEDYGPVMLESGPAVPGDTVDSYRDPPRDQTNMVGQSTVITKAFRAAGIFDSGGTAPVPLRVRYDQKAQGAIDALDAPATLRVDGRPGSHIVPSSCPSVNAFSDSCQESVGEHTTLASMESQRPRQQQQQRRWQRKGVAIFPGRAKAQQICVSGVCFTVCAPAVQFFKRIVARTLCIKSADCATLYTCAGLCRTPSRLRLASLATGSLSANQRSGESQSTLFLEYRSDFREMCAVKQGTICRPPGK
jgi:hypothetical protein